MHNGCLWPAAIWMTSFSRLALIVSVTISRTADVFTKGGPYLTYKNQQYDISAGSLKPGLTYTAIVEQATSDTVIFKGVPGIATYATLTFVKFQTAGEAAAETCPVDANASSSASIIEPSA